MLNMKSPQWFVFYFLFFFRTTKKTINFFQFMFKTHEMMLERLNKLFPSPLGKIEIRFKIDCVLSIISIKS